LVCSGLSSSGKTRRVRERTTVKKAKGGREGSIGESGQEERGVCGKRRGVRATMQKVLKFQKSQGTDNEGGKKRGIKEQFSRGGKGDYMAERIQAFYPTKRLGHLEPAWRKGETGRQWKDRKKIGCTKGGGRSKRIRSILSQGCPDPGAALLCKREAMVGGRAESCSGKGVGSRLVRRAFPFNLTVLNMCARSLPIEGTEKQYHGGKRKRNTENSYR